MEGKVLPVGTDAVRRTPWGAIISLLSALLYGASPIDLIPDVIPLLGWVDDAIIVPILLIFAFTLWRRNRNKKRSPA